VSGNSFYFYLQISCRSLSDVSITGASQAFKSKACGLAHIYLITTHHLIILLSLHSVFLHYDPQTTPMVDCKTLCTSLEENKRTETSFIHAILTLWKFCWRACNDTE